MTKYISKRAEEEAKSVVLLIQQDPKIQRDLDSICRNSGGHRDTVSIVNFLRGVLGDDLVSFSDDDLKSYIEEMKAKYKQDINEDVDAGLIGLKDDRDENQNAEYIEHGKSSM